MENPRIKQGIWLVTLLISHPKLTFKEINVHWMADTTMSNGKSMSRLKLNRFIGYAKDVLGVLIVCERPGGYYYHIAGNEDLRATEWLISSHAINRVYNDYPQLRDRILFEDIPSGQFYLSTIINAMSLSKAIEMSYQKFTDDEPVTSYIEPYCVKLSHQRWYLLARKDGRDYLQVFALDRVRSMRVLGDSQCYVSPNFSAVKYFANCFGVHRGDGKGARRVVIRANLFWRNYLRTLPLHVSQCETQTTADSSLFEYSLVLSPDLVNQLLSYGPEVEVLEPRELRDTMRDNILRMHQLYSKDT